MREGKLAAAKDGAAGVSAREAGHIRFFDLAFSGDVDATIERFRIEARFAETGSAEELDRALAQLAKEGVQALVVLPSAGLFNAERQRILQFALSQRWPVISSGGWAAAGALLSYSADIVALYRRAAHYVDRIL